jgi:hypothetical protein
VEVASAPAPPSATAVICGVPIQGAISAKASATYLPKRFDFTRLSVEFNSATGHFTDEPTMQRWD